MAKAPKLAELEPNYMEAIEKLSQYCTQLRQKIKQESNPEKKRDLKCLLAKVYLHRLHIKKDAECCARYYERGFKDYEIQL